MLKKAKEYFEIEEYDKAFEIFKELAKEGSAEAMYHLGILYYEGWGVEQSEDEAIKWWKRANRAGSLDAKYMLQTIKTDSSVFGRE
jgi:TPR repeat protein